MSGLKRARVVVPGRSCSLWGGGEHRERLPGFASRARDLRACGCGRCVAVPAGPDVAVMENLPAIPCHGCCLAAHGKPHIMSTVVSCNTEGTGDAPVWL